MSGWLPLFVMMMRRIRRRLPVLCGFAVACIALLGMLFGALATDYAQEEEQTMLTVGLVGDTSESFLGIGIMTVQRLDISRFYLDFESMEESEAQDALRQGDIVAYMVMPDHFVSDIVQGKDVDLTLVSGNTPDALGPAMMREIAATVEDILIHAEKGMYGYMALQRQHGMHGDEQYEVAQGLTLVYIDSIIGRDTVTEFTVVGIGEGLSLVPYYTAALTVLLWMLMALVYTGISYRDDTAFFRLVYIRGYGVAAQTTAEVLPLCAVLWMLSVCCMTLLGAIGQCRGIAWSDTLSGVWAYAAAGCRLLPAAMLMAAWEQCLLEILPRRVSGLTLQVLLTVLCAFASGLFYPTSALPTPLRIVGECLPTGAALSYTADVLAKAPLGGSLSVTLGYTALLILAAMLLRKRRIGCVTR